MACLKLRMFVQANVPKNWIRGMEHTVGYEDRLGVKVQAEDGVILCLPPTACSNA